jgi:hypothetical protein
MAEMQPAPGWAWTKEDGGYVLVVGACRSRVWRDALGLWRGFIAHNGRATSQVGFRSADEAWAWCEAQLEAVTERSREPGG